MKNFAVIDLETDPFLFGRTPEPFCGGFYDGFDYSHYWGKDTIKYLAEDIAEFDGYVYAHNGGKFDWHYFINYIETGSIKIIHGRIAECKIGKATIRDSFLILPTPLSAYKKDDFDYTLLEKDVREKNKLEILRYLENDCVYLYDYINHFVTLYGHGLTLAGRVLKDLEQRCGAIEKCGKEHDDIFRQFYFGGRVECFETGIINAPLKFYDIKSAYPAAMKKWHACGKEYDITDEPVINKYAFYHVRGFSRGAFPIRQDNKTMFPHAFGEYKITGYEYTAALELKLFDLDEIIAVYIPKNTRNFSPFVTHHYERKLAAEQSGNAIERLLAKLFMNSGYGKLAANPAKYKNYELREIGDCTSDELEFLEHDDFGGKWLLAFPVDPESPQAIYYDVATAASITGYVRTVLLRAINSVERPIYCDTDSILCADGGMLDIGADVGQWDLENEITSVAVAGKKLYAALKTDGEYKTASKGVRASAADIYAVAAGETRLIENPAPCFSVSRIGEFNAGLPRANWNARNIRKT